jgi:hypothetical protein
MGICWKGKGKDGIKGEKTKEKNVQTKRIVLTRNMTADGATQMRALGLGAVVPDVGVGEAAGGGRERRKEGREEHVSAAGESVLGVS